MSKSNHHDGDLWHKSDKSGSPSRMLAFYLIGDCSYTDFFLFYYLKNTSVNLDYSLILFDFVFLKDFFH